MPTATQHILRKLKGQSKFDVELNDISINDLREYLDDYFPYEYFLTGEGNKAEITTYPEGQQALSILLENYWNIDKHNPKKFFAPEISALNQK